MHIERVRKGKSYRIECLLLELHEEFPHYTEKISINIPSKPQRTTALSSSMLFLSFSILFTGGVFL